MRVAVLSASCSSESSELQFEVRAAVWSHSYSFESELQFEVRLPVWSQSYSLE